MNKSARRILIIGVLLTIVGIATVLRRAGRHSALEQYKTGLLARGEKLTFEEIAVAPSTDPAHAASRQFFATNQFTNRGVTPVLMEFVAPGRAVPAWGNGWRRDAQTTNASYESGLAEVRQTLEHPSPDTGWKYSNALSNAIAGPRVDFYRVRGVAYALVNAEIRDLHEGNLDAALANQHALASLALLNRNEFTSVNGGIRAIVVGLGLNATWEAVQAPGWTEAQLASLQRDWEQLNMLDALERVLLGERAFGQTTMAAVRHANGPEFNRILHFSVGRSNPPPPMNPFAASFWRERVWNERLVAVAYQMAGMDEDELLQLQLWSELLEVVHNLQAGRSWPEVREREENSWKHIETRFDHVQGARLLVSARVVPNLKEMTRTAIRLETQRRMTITALAIKRYELRHSRPPAELAALAPEFLTAAPVDPMSGQPFGYHVEPERSFVLYSVGEDGHDDGGDATPVKTSAKAGLWEGRDAVWPKAVTNEVSAVLTTKQ